MASCLPEGNLEMALPSLWKDYFCFQAFGMQATIEDCSRKGASHSGRFSLSKASTVLSIYNAPSTEAYIVLLCLTDQR
jgi:hypothetical protein